MLPAIRASSEVYGTGVGELAGVPISGDLGDQHAALFGQACFEPGQMKCTYGTGAFLLMHTGERPVPSRHGLITTLAAKIGDGPATYALEGSVAVTGSLIGWLRDNLGIIADAAEVEALARSVPDSGDVVFVPAFSGPVRPALAQRGPGRDRRSHRLRDACPHRASGARERPRTRCTTSARRWPPTSGRHSPGSCGWTAGMIGNELLMQFQADILDRTVVAPPIAETTALGAAYAAGLAVGFWSGLDELRAMDRADRRWEPCDGSGRRVRRGSPAGTRASSEPGLARRIVRPACNAAAMRL